MGSTLFLVIFICFLPVVIMAAWKYYFKPRYGKKVNPAATANKPETAAHQGGRKKHQGRQ